MPFYRYCTCGPSSIDLEDASQLNDKSLSLVARSSSLYTGENPSSSTFTCVLLLLYDDVYKRAYLTGRKNKFSFSFFSKMSEKKLIFFPTIFGKSQKKHLSAPFGKVLIKMIFSCLSRMLFRRYCICVSGNSPPFSFYQSLTLYFSY